MRHLTKIPGIDLNQFIGREEQINRVVEIISNESSNILVVNGIGGIGKTALVLALVKQTDITKRYDHISWVASSSSSLKVDFIKAFSDQDLPISFNQKDDIETNFERITQYLRKLNNNGLLIIDNCDNLEEINNIKQELLDLHLDIIITSRSQPENYQQFQLDSLTDEEALLLFYTYFTKEKDDRLASKIIKQIDKHSLLIILLAKAAQNNDKLKLSHLEKITKTKSFNTPNLKTNI